MKVELVENPDADVVGWESQVGEREGWFFVDSEGAVLYRSPLDTRIWGVGDNLSVFHSAALAWNAYAAPIPGQPESTQLAEIATLRDSLKTLGLLTTPESYWVLLLEQAEHGLL